MSRRRILRLGRRVAAAQCRALAVLAVAAKLLVPVGYMPAALADGGPVALCGSGLPAALGATHEHGSARHAHGSASGHSLTATGHEQSHATPDTGHEGEPSTGHHEWERCSLGGLASLAAIATEWHCDFRAGTESGVAVPEVAYLPQRANLGFRSRAPPVSLS